MLRTSITGCGLALALVLIGPGYGSAQELKLTIDAGRVTLAAHNVSVRQILAEWERVGQTKVPNRERIPDSVVTMSLVDVPESSALSTLLRSGNGYLAVARATPVANASAYRAILLMAAAPRSPASLPQSGASRADPMSQVPDRRFLNAPQGGNPQGLGGLRAGSPFAISDHDVQDPQDDDPPGDPARQNPGLFQMRVIGPNGQVINVPSPEVRPGRGDQGDNPPGGMPQMMPSPTFPTAPGGAARPGEVLPGPVKRPGTPPTRPPG
jgi:hypothetical protein